MKRFSITTLFMLGLWATQWVQGQILDITPVFPTLDDNITIIYDAKEGNGGVVGVTPVYAHAGLITDQSTSPTDWQFVQGTWGTADPKVLMTDLGNDRHQISFTPRSFYSAPQGTNAQQLSFVFRNEDGTQVGRSTDGADIYYDLYDGSGLEVRFVKPGEGGLVNVGETVSVRAAASLSSSLELYLNDTLISSNTGLEINTTFTAGKGGINILRFVANDGNETKTDETSFIVPGDPLIQDPPMGIEPGINYISDTSVILALVAPDKELIYVEGDFNEWKTEDAYRMALATDNELFWVQINGLTPGEQYAYQYFIDGGIRIADPYAELVLDENNDGFISSSVYPNLKPFPSGDAAGRVGVLQTAQQPYQWQNNNFVRPDNDELIIYELLVRDFVSTHDYKTLIDTLDYLENLGVNVIELMPIMEFENNISWGYNPSFFFAPDKYYGTEDDLKAFIDECHGRGIAVVLDMVLNHAFGQCPLVEMYPANANPFFNETPTHPFNVGTDFNHESPLTQYFSKRVLEYWIEEFRFDGYRMDLSKGFTQRNNPNDVGAWGAYDASRIAILKDYYDHIRQIDPSVYFILEHFADNTEEKELAEYGMLVWGKMVDPYNEATMGYTENGKSDLAGGLANNRGWNEPHLVTYLESHDEERLMYKNLTFGNSSGAYNVRDLNTALARQEIAGAFFFTLPGPKMFWQFAELGYEVPIDQNGRTGPKPIRWNYLDEARRRNLYNAWSAMINLRMDYQDLFNTNDRELDLRNGVKKIKLNSQDLDIFIMGNFEMTNQSVQAGFQHPGEWTDYFSRQVINVSNVDTVMTMKPGQLYFFTDQALPNPGVFVKNDALVPAIGEVAVVPNPAYSEASVIYTLAQPTALEMDLIDMSGRIVRQQSIPTQIPGIYEAKFDVSSLNAGVYMIHIKTEQGTVTQKVVVSK